VITVVEKAVALVMAPPAQQTVNATMNNIFVKEATKTQFHPVSVMVVEMAVIWQ